MDIRVHRFTFLAITLVLLASLVWAQQGAALKVGDKVEAEYFADGKYRPATLIEIDNTGKYQAPYVVLFDDKTLGTTRDSLPASKIRGRGNFVGAFKIGDRVDHLAGKNTRGTVIAVNGHDYKIH